MDVKEIRIRLGLSQKSFAELLGVATYTLIRWETSKTKPSPMARRLLEEIQKGEG